MRYIRNWTREAVKQISADERMMKNRAGTAAKLRKHRPPQRSIRHKDVIKLEKNFNPD